MFSIRRRQWFKQAFVPAQGVPRSTRLRARFRPHVEGLEERTLLSFGFPINTSLGNGTISPIALAVGDFNHDGNLDVAVAALDTLNVSVLLGDGTGSFTRPPGSPFATGPGQPASIATGDFNDDGNPDLAVANDAFGFGSVGVFVGDGTGQFSPAAASPFTTSPGSSFVAVADFNHDGQDDLAVANAANSNNVTILLGNGQAQLVQAIGSPFAVGQNPNSIAIGDFNRDGQLDLAVSNEISAGTVSVLLGLGTGFFTPATGSPFNVGPIPNGVAAGDFNRDGILDLTTDNLDNTITLLLGNGNGGFVSSPASPFPAGPSPNSSAVADFDRDGKLDLAVANQVPQGTATVLQGDGNGSFTPLAGSPFRADANSIAVAAGDFNNDGAPDLVVANRTTDNVSVLLNETVVLSTPNQMFAAQTLENVAGITADQATVDFYAALLDQGISRFQLVQQIQTTPEYRENVVQDLFQAHLGRPADPAGLEFFTQQLAGGVAEEHVQAQIIASDDYLQSRGGGSDAGFLAALYQDVLGRPLDAAGGYYHSLRLLRGATRQRVALDVIASPEARQKVVQDLFQKHLNRPATGDELQFYANALKTNSKANVEAALAGSQESFTAVSSDPNQNFVQQVYLDLLNRPADPTGLAFFTSLLDTNMATLSQVVLMIEASQEYLTDVVQDLYQSLLLRPADPTGLASFVAILQGGGTIEAVQAEIIGSVEYFQTRAGSTINGFLTAVYLDLLNRPVDPTGQATFGTALATGTLTTGQVAGAILGSLEYQTDLVSGYYLEFLRRPVDPTGLDFFVGQLQAGQTNQWVVSMIVGSVEYYIFAQNNQGGA